MEDNMKRSAFMVVAGIVVVIGLMMAGYRLFNLNDEPRLSKLATAPTPHVPPEVIKLLTDTDAALKRDDLNSARTDIAALQQLVPDHPRLPYFESLLQEREAALRAAHPSSVAKVPSRHISPPKESVEISSATVTRRVPEQTSPANGAMALGAPVSAPALATFKGETLEDAPAVEEPKIVKRIEPEYPDDAARKGIEGIVDLSLSVSPQGAVKDVSVVNAWPANVFNRAAIAAVRRWKYQPKTVDGKPVEGQVQVRLAFKLDPHQ